MTSKVANIYICYIYMFIYVKQLFLVQEFQHADKDLLPSGGNIKMI